LRGKAESRKIERQKAEKFAYIAARSISNLKGKSRKTDHKTGPIRFAQSQNESEVDY
jgi:hypothetical protein